MCGTCVLLFITLPTWCLALQENSGIRRNFQQRIIPGFRPPGPLYPGHYDDGRPPDHYPVQHAGLPRSLGVVPLPLKDSDHELTLNVSWLPPLGPPASDYSLEVHSETDTEDCRMIMCYEYNIPGSSTWWTIPAQASPVPETCAVRPGCSYRVKLLAHPWDGHTFATLPVRLKECEAGVCSCAHSPRLPVPNVSARTVTVGGEVKINVTWTLPPPAYPQRLPKGLQKLFYFVSIGQQMVSDAHPSPWFAHKVTRHVSADGPIATGDGPRFLLLPTVERMRDKLLKPMDVKLLARVSVVDERNCIGPAGNATAYDPAKGSKMLFDTYILWIFWATLAGVVVVCVAGAAASSAGAMKRVLRALRPAPVSAADTPARRGWFGRATSIEPKAKSRAHVVSASNFARLQQTDKLTAQYISLITSGRRKSAHCSSFVDTIATLRTFSDCSD